MPAKMRRSTRLLAVLLFSCLAVAGWALVEGPSAWAQTATPQGPPKVSAKGSAAGQLVRDGLIRVKLQATDTAGWQHIDTIEVTLALRGQPIDRVTVTPAKFSIVIVNSGAAPVSIGQEGFLRGAYFNLDNAKTTVSTSRTQYNLSFPIRLVADPPPGARLFLQVSDVSGITPKQIPLSPPVVNVDKGFPWGTIGLAVAGALFIGAFVGNTFSTRRSRVRPNVYATVARRLQEEERAKR
jgi:hypothetical protein